MKNPKGKRKEVILQDGYEDTGCRVCDQKVQPDGGLCEQIDDNGTFINYHKDTDEALYIVQESQVLRGQRQVEAQGSHEGGDAGYAFGQHRVASQEDHEDQGGKIPGGYQKGHVIDGNRQRGSAIDREGFSGEVHDSHLPEDREREAEKQAETDIYTKSVILFV
jgi:hypothetical protein